jgi:hypothetical protein
LSTRKALVLFATHGVAIAVGFALGVYLLPILIAPPPAGEAELAAVREQALFMGEFRRDLPGSDAFHWGEGRVFIARRNIAFEGALAPGPDYKLYLSPEYVETKGEFERAKLRMVRIADVKTFGNFLIQIPDSVDPVNYNAVIIWCETFSMFITAARYQFTDH